MSVIISITTDSKIFVERKANFVRYIATARVRLHSSDFQSLREIKEKKTCIDILH